VLGVATKEMPAGSTSVTSSDEQGMCLRGFIVLEDPLRPEIADTIQRLHELGVELKVITGDNHLVAHTLAKKMGLKYPVPITGKDLQSMSDSALIHRVKKTQVFAEIEPNQKARIIHALKRAGNVVGYIGDGINDGSALHTADAGISVSNAVDVAKEAADFVMLESGLDVLINAVLEGRRTFANTMKYIFMATSANFGNMFSLAGASLLVPFLPLLPKQVLMMNFLTDIPEMFIATDTVDSSQQQKPQRWDIKFLRRFMIIFGILSSAFDFATFGILLYLKVPEAVFRTAWFVESVSSAALIVLVVRSRASMFKSKPGTRLLQATLAIVALVFILPFTPLAPIFGLTALTPALLLAIVLIIFLYITSAEITKHFFFRSHLNQ
jgi:Mg2+-importing ATPase